jgi:hypothetical protein
MNVPVVVVTQREPADWVAVHPDAPFTFVTSKVPEAVEQARARPGEGHVAVTAGTIAGHCLELGLPDEDLGAGRGAGGTDPPRGFYLSYGFTDSGRVMRGENVLAPGLAARG